MAKDKPIPQIFAKVMYQMHRPNRLTGEIELLRSGLIKPGDRIVDIGCGTGHLSLEMALLTGATGRVTAVDIHPLAMDNLRRIIKENGCTNIQCILTDSFSTGLDGESTDTVFIFNTMEMIREKHLLVEELARILKPGALVVIRNKMSFRLSQRNYTDVFSNTCFRFVKQEGKTIYFQKQK